MIYDAYVLEYLYTLKSVNELLKVHGINFYVAYRNN